jgi:hypothetical protein
LIKVNIYEEGKQYFIIDDKYNGYMILPNDTKEDGRKLIEKEVIIDNQLITGDGTKITLYVP